jgi:hypothetical protein
MLDVLPIGVIAFLGTGIQGTSPKRRGSSGSRLEIQEKGRLSAVGDQPLLATQSGPSADGSGFPSNR